MEHRAIFEAVRRHDGDASAATLVTHLAHTVFAVIDMIDPTYEPRLFNSILAVLLDESSLKPVTGIPASA